jgi:hypothetical protein
MICVYLCISLHLCVSFSSFVFFCWGLADGLIQVRSEFSFLGSCEVAVAKLSRS